MRKTVAKKATDDAKPAKKAAPVAKKTAVKKAASKSTTTTVEPVVEVFDTRANQPEKVTVPSGMVLLLINGRTQGNVEVGKATMKEFVTSQAQRAGIRTFSVYADGAKLDSSDANKPASSFAKFEIVAKDSRG